MHKLSVDFTVQKHACVAVLRFSFTPRNCLLPSLDSSRSNAYFNIGTIDHVKE